jgi:hypothetical protein
MTNTAPPLDPETLRSSPSCATGKDIIAGEVISTHPGSDSVTLSLPEFLMETHCLTKVVYETPLIERDSAPQPSVHSTFLERST